MTSLTLWAALRSALGAPTKRCAASRAPLSEFTRSKSIASWPFSTGVTRPTTT